MALQEAGQGRVHGQSLGQALVCHQAVQHVLLPRPRGNTYKGPIQKKKRIRFSLFLSKLKNDTLRIGKTYKSRYLALDETSY